MRFKIPALTILCLIFTSGAFAWNCSDPLASRVDVGPNKPAGTPGDGDGQYYIGSDAANPKDYYVCQVPKTPVTPTPSTSTQSQQQNQNQSQNASANSTSNSGATSKSSSSATGGNSTATGGSATATGGLSAVKNSGNSTLTNSGNSSTTSTNTNTNTATGGAGGAGGTSSASAANNGNGSNNTNYQSTTNVAATKIPVETAIGIAPPSNMNCSLGYGAGVQGASLGVSGAFSRIDSNCADLVVALSARNRISYCKVYIQNKYAKKAGVSLEDCMQSEVVPVSVSTVPVPVTPPPPTIIVMPAPVAPPVVVPAMTQTSTLIDVGSCTMTNLKLTNVCKRMLDDAALRLENYPNARLVLTGPVEATQAAAFLRTRVSRSRIELKLADEQDYTLNIQLFEVK